MASPRTIPYSAIVGRPHFGCRNLLGSWCGRSSTWRNGTSEADAAHRAVAPGGAQVMPDVPNLAWFEYGMRVGFWR